MEMEMKEERKEEEQRDSLHCSQCKRDVSVIVQFAFVCLDCSTKDIFSYDSADGTKKIINLEKAKSSVVCRNCKQELHECHKSVPFNDILIAKTKIELREIIQPSFMTPELDKVLDDDLLH